MPSLLSRAAPILREEFNLERKWRISSDLKQGLFCDLFQLCPGRCDQRGPSCCPGRDPALTDSSSALLPWPAGATRRTETGFWLRTKRAPGHPSHDTGADPNFPRGCRFTFCTDPWEVHPGNRLSRSSSLNFLVVQTFSQSQQYVDSHIPLWRGRMNQETRGTGAPFHTHPPTPPRVKLESLKRLLIP